MVKRFVLGSTVVFGAVVGGAAVVLVSAAGWLPPATGRADGSANNRGPATFEISGAVTTVFFGKDLPWQPESASGPGPGVRWSLAPKARPVAMPPDDSARRPPDFLATNVASRAGPGEVDWMAATAADSADGRLTIQQIGADGPGRDNGFSALPDADASFPPRVPPWTRGRTPG